MKLCSKCLISKAKTYFSIQKATKDGLTPWCKPCTSIYRKSHYKQNKDLELAQIKEYQAAHKEQRSINQKKRRQEDPIFRLACNLRNSVRKILKFKDRPKLLEFNEYLGCTKTHLFLHIELQFKPGMTWDNYGFGPNKWNIDHRLPLSAAVSKEDLYKLCHFTNLQPLWQTDNFNKKDKYITADLEQFLTSFKSNQEKVG